MGDVCDIREDFLTFVKLARVRAADIANAITQSLEGFGLPLSGLRGQGFNYEWGKSWSPGTT